jgi:hypothetical protein
MRKALIAGFATAPSPPSSAGTIAVAVVGASAMSIPLIKRLFLNLEYTLQFEFVMTAANLPSPESSLLLKIVGDLLMMQAPL